MSNAQQKDTDIIPLRAEHEHRLARQLDNDRKIKEHFEKIFSITLSHSGGKTDLTIEGDKRALGLAKRGFAYLATKLVTEDRITIDALYELAPTLAPERKEPMPTQHKRVEFKKAANDHRGQGQGGGYDRGRGGFDRDRERGPQPMQPFNKGTRSGILSSVRPKTANQVEFMNKVAGNDVTFGVGPAGTGKTFLAAYMALKALEEGKIEKIFLARPAVGSGKDLGALPGELGEKLAPFMYPLYDELSKLVGSETLKDHMEAGTIELAPIEFMRGRTFTNAFIIVDEVQNASYEQIKMALTRLGEGSKLVVTGDPAQSDLKGELAGGFDTILKKLDNIPNVAQQHFSKSDIVRHKTIAAILNALEGPEATPAPAISAPKAPGR